MRKGIFLMLLAIMCSAEAAEWVLVGENSPNGNIGVHYDTYANPSTIRKVGSRAQMWILFNNKTASVVNGRSFMSVKSQTEYDCKEEKSRALYYSFHVGSMGTDGLIFRNPEIGEWEPIAPDSISDSLWRVACGMHPSSIPIKLSREERINIAVYQIITTYYEHGVLGVRPILDNCYSTAVQAQAGLSDDLADCIAQDIAFTTLAVDLFQALAKKTNKSTDELQSDFSKHDSGVERITGALRSVGIADSSRSAELKEIARLSQDALLSAVESINSK